jgi:carboxyl-terminal processing protease
VTQLEAYKHQLDDNAEQGIFTFLDLAVKLQETGIEKTQSWYREILAEPFTFDGNEIIETDPKKKPFAKNDEELKSYWQDAMKWETMTRYAEKLKKKNEGDEDFKEKTEAELEAEARKDVLKVFDDWYTRLQKRKRADHLSIYLNSFTNIYDPHTEYYKPIDKQNFDIGMSGRLEGIGARLQTDGEYTKVSEIIVGGPAWKADELEADDKIMKVAQGDDPEWTDITGMVINDVVQLIRGKPGTKVRLFIKKATGGTEEISIIRDVVILEEGFAKSLLIEQEDQTIGYIRLPKFYADFQDRNGRRCAKDIETELSKLKSAGVDGIILDLRNNGGGSLRDVVKMGGFFIEEGPIVQVKSRNRQPEVLEDENPNVQYNGPLIIMVNQFSASASEILAAAMQDYERAIIVGAGSSTFGKGTVQRFFDLDAVVRGNSDVKPLGNVKVTMQKFFRVDGGSTQLKGVTPDIILPSNWFYIETGEKEEDFPMAWSKIDPVPHSQNVYSLHNLPKIRERSAARINQNEVFNQVYDRAKKVKEQRDDSDHELNLLSFQKEDEAWQKESEAYEKLFEKEVITGARNLAVDLPAIEADESKKALNDEWLKDISKDVYLQETLNIMRDMIVIK